MYVFKKRALSPAMVVTLVIAVGCAGNAASGGPDEPPTGAATNDPSDGRSAMSALLFPVADASYSDGRYGVEIVRDYENHQQAKLISLAERTQPSHDAVAAKTASEGGSSPATAAGENLWWYTTFDGIRIPYAVTSDALSYYTAVIDSFMAGDFSATNGLTMKKAFLKYEAHVQEQAEYPLGGDTLTGVSVVHMTLSWSQYCGPECAMAFFKERTVIFDQHGDIIAVLDDGETDYVVS